MHEYFDKNGTRIRRGDTLIHDDGDEEKVFACGDDDDLDLGLDANNYESPAFTQGVATAMYYPLSNFDLSEWRVK